MIDIINYFLKIKKKIDIMILPSEGYFYNDDFVIYIKRATDSQINFYRQNINIDNISNVIFLIKKIVKENTYFSKKYTFNDLKSIDVIFVFLEIVKFSMNKKISIKIDTEKYIDFSSENFNYFFRNNKELLKYYNEYEKNFIIDDYKLTIPSIGVENSLTKFLIKKIDIEKEQRYADYFYDFTYFLGNKNYLDDFEIENLIEIFNFELDKKESEKIKKIIEKFIPIQTYQFIEDGRIIEITSKVNLKTIWD